MNKRMIVWISIFVLIILSVGLVTAIPIPHTVRGTVFDIDGITDVTMPTHFSVENLGSGNIMYGKVGKGPHTGMYSASVDGYDGDTLILLFWNKYHNTTFNLTLAGVMHDVDVLINDSYPMDAPVILSLPSTKVLLPNSYLYDVDAFDVQDSILDYSLLVAPDGMTIDSSGIILWSPNTNGVYSVVVQVIDSDGLASNQSFDVHVIAAKRQSGGSSSRRHLYPSGTISLGLAEDDELSNDTNNDVFDEIPDGLSDDILDENIGLKKNENVIPIDTDLLVEQEETKKRIIFGFINRLPLYQQFSHERATLSIEDDMGNADNFVSFSFFGKEFYFKVIDISPRSDVILRAKNNLLSGELVKSVTNLFTRADVTLNETLYQEEPQTIMGDIAYYSTRPFPIFKSLERPVYMYIIDLREKDELDILFSVQKSWLDNLHLKPENITLFSYDSGKYSQLETVMIEEQGDVINYVALKNDVKHKYFAISIELNNSLEASKILLKQVEDRKEAKKGVTKYQPFLVEGDIEISPGIPFPEGSSVTVVNQNQNTTTIGKTGIAGHTGAFSLIIEGERNDEIVITITYANNKYQQTMKLTGDLKIE